jgi:hypothetical protein
MLYTQQVPVAPHENVCERLGFTWTLRLPDTVERWANGPGLSSFAA